MPTMSELITKAEEAWLYWRLLITRIVLHSIATLCIAWVAVTQNVDMDHLSKWKAVGLGASVIALWTDKLIAFFDQTMSRLAKGQLPNGNGESKHDGGTETKPKET